MSLTIEKMCFAQNGSQIVEHSKLQVCNHCLKRSVLSQGGNEDYTLFEVACRKLYRRTITQDLLSHEFCMLGGIEHSKERKKYLLRLLYNK